MAFIDSIVAEYLNSYKGLVVAEALEPNSAILSFPFHYSANHRIELTVTSIAKDKYIISDMAKTVSELQDSGVSVNQKMRERFSELARIAGMNIVRDHLVLESGPSDLGKNIQRLLEAAKTIGDVYLVHRRARPKPDVDLLGEVRGILNERRVHFKEKDTVGGTLENHRVDFMIPANGRPATAIAVLYAHNSHLVAEAWAFKCDDIRSRNQMEIGLIYDTSGDSWEQDSKAILETKANFAVPSDQLPMLGERLAAH
jgi:hypothetical protein